MTPDTPSGPNATLTEVVLPGVVEPDGLVIRHRPVPTPAKGQALVQMLATGVSFAENSMRRNRYPGQPKFPFVRAMISWGSSPPSAPTLIGRSLASGSRQ